MTTPAVHTTPVEPTTVETRPAEQAPPAGPARPAALNLDTLDRQDAPLPFDFIHDGYRYVLSDPKDIDWQDVVAAMSNPHMFFKLVLPADDRRRFFESRLPVWKMNILMERYQDHYGLPAAPNAGGLPR